MLLQATNTYGSPSLEELEQVSQEVSYQLDSLLGPEDAGTIELMVSSPVRGQRCSIPCAVQLLLC